MQMADVNPPNVNYRVWYVSSKTTILRNGVVHEFSRLSDARLLGRRKIDNRIAWWNTRRVYGIVKAALLAIRF